MKKILLLTCVLCVLISLKSISQPFSKPSQADSSQKSLTINPAKWMKVINKDTLFRLSKPEIKSILILGQRYEGCQETQKYLTNEIEAYGVAMRELEIAVNKGEQSIVNYKKLGENKDGVILEQTKEIKTGKLKFRITLGVAVGLLIGLIAK